MPLIGITGPMHVGKSTVAQSFRLAFSPHDGPRVIKVYSFASPLKEMLRAFLLNIGHVNAADLIADKTAALPELNDYTVRHTLQTLGTEWGRIAMAAPYKPSLWVTACMAQVDRHAPSDLIIIDDVRFEDEAEAIRARGGIVVELIRTGVERIATHASEVGVTPDVIIANNGEPKLAAVQIMAEVYKRQE